MTRRYTKRLAKSETERRLGQVVFPSRNPSRHAGKASGGSAAYVERRAEDSNL